MARKVPAGEQKEMRADEQESVVFGARRAGWQAEKLQAGKHKSGTCANENASEQARQMQASRQKKCRETSRELG